MQEIKEAVRLAVKDVFDEDVELELTRPEEQFGDYATNVALQLAHKLNKNPRQVAEELVSKLGQIDGVAKVEVAGPGFINLTLTDEKLAKIVKSSTNLPKPLQGREIVVEYSDPNPFKVLHVGHLYTSVVGDAIASLLESSGASVHRVNYGGDVGLHVAKTIWAVLRNIGGENPEKLNEIEKSDHANWLSQRYVEGNEAYENDESAKPPITELNKEIYRIQSEHDESSPLAQIYWTTRQWSYDYFDEFYTKIGTRFDKYYPESEVVDSGIAAVKANIGDVFEESDGAIVFMGETHNLHTRVFINSQGLPTYEAKEVGLLIKKEEDYHPYKSVYITGNDINEYMQVVFKAVEQFRPELVAKAIHITHGMVKLAGGVKMSSRLGNILSAESVLDMAAAANKELNQQEDFDVALAAVKYSFLKNRIGGDTVFDPSESVSLEGNSGPYLQYAHARARSILAKTGPEGGNIEDLEDGERSLARKISEYPEVVAKATDELMPHHVCTYLYELAQVFNRFYEGNRVVGDERQSTRLQLVETYADVLKNGLGLLNITAPDKM